MTGSQASETEVIRKFLEWMWWEQCVEFYRRIPQELECPRCHGRGHTKDPHPPFGECEEPDEISTLLKRVTPKQLGYECNRCSGKGYIEQEFEQSGPDNAEYWINLYFGIEQQRLPVRVIGRLYTEEPY